MRSRKTIERPAIILFFILFFMVLSSWALSSEKILYLCNDAAWCWFSDPRGIVLSEENGERLISGGVSKNGSIVAFSYDTRTRSINTGTIHRNLEADDHNNPAFLKSLDGHVLAFYAKHHKDSLFMSKTVNGIDITVWSNPRRLNPVNSKDISVYGTPKYTYANPFRLSTENNRIYLFGRWTGFKATMIWSDDDGETWSSSHVVISPHPYQKGNRPYVKYFSDGKSRIHFTFTDGHPRNEATNSVYYAYYEKGGFYRLDGTKICNIDDLPFEPAEASVVYNAKTTGERAWVHDIKVDSNGFVRIAYARFPDQWHHHYYSAHPDGSHWSNDFICDSGKWFPETPDGVLEREPHYSGGISIDSENLSVVYLSREVNGVFEIEKWFTKDNGKNWKSEPITHDSRYNQVRPFSIKSAQNTFILWMENEKYVHFKEFSSSMKMSVSEGGQ